MKKLVFGLLACASLLAVSCESSDVASDDSVYEEGVDRSKITITNRKSVDRSKITITNRQSVDRSKITISNRKK
ncbi:hypothetical protein [uncultured Zobellia sp.]|uniref:hypothetical protein n=1 Tax=uncultured Zobellia sp. TaxID=255433 RepID=UPI002595D90B|nr:hypothetical protein [uncultured Zobellia sp.]